MIQSKTDHILILSYLEKKEETKEQEGGGVERGQRREGRRGREDRERRREREGKRRGDGEREKGGEGGEKRDKERGGREDKYILLEEAAS